MVSKTSHQCCKSCLYIGSASHGFRRLDTGTKTHKGSCTTDNKGIKEYGKHLYKSLFDGVTDKSRSCSVRCRTDTGFIGIQSSFNTEHQARTGNTSENRLKIKGICKNPSKNRRHHRNVHNHHNERNENIDSTHNRH